MKEQDDSLTKLKELLIDSTALAYFDPNKQTTIYVDASPVGLGAILTLKHPDGQKVITYASKALSPVEQRYSQTEREALAVVWACEHFHVYILGVPVTVVTDHKPLLGIYGKTSSRTSALLERWCLHLIPYDMMLTYEPGHRNPADYMSRHPNNVHDTDCRATKVAKEYIQLITEEAKQTVTDLEDLIAESNSDETLSTVRDALTYGKWPTTNTDPDVKRYSDIKDELTITRNGIILRSHRICVPKNLQKEVVDLAHRGHQGMTRIKQLLREKVWFPGIGRIPEEKVKNCFPCQAVTPQNTREPIQVTLTNHPWDQVSCDFADVGN